VIFSDYGLAEGE